MTTTARESGRIGRLARRLRPGPPSLIFAALLCGLVVQPFLAAYFPSSADGKLHLYRLIELDHALRHGVLFPRWSPDLVYGYGFPLFNYYAPLPYYLGSAFHLIGLSYQAATQATFVALIVLAGWAVYRWVAEVFDPTAGIVAAAAYVYMPYMGHVSLHRGALGEVAGLALMPLILWAFTRLANETTRGRFALASLSLAALLFAHNLTALLFAPLLLGSLLVLWLVYGRGARRAVTLLGAAALGLALGAFFWLPAFAERDLVQIDRLFGPATFDFRLNFLSLKELFTPPAPYDPQRIRQLFFPALGLPQVALVLVAVWRLARRGLPPHQRILTWAALGGAALLTLLVLPVSLPLWEAISLLRFVQFPWRLLGPAGLLTAFVAGAAFGGADALPARLRQPAVALSVLAMATYGLWWLFGASEPPLAADTVQDIHRFEIENDAAGTTSFVDYLPNTVEQLPPADGLAGRYAGTDVIPRLSLESLPDEVQVLTQRAGLTWAEAAIETPSPFTSTWDWFAFPGWRATVDGDAAPLTPSAPYGLIQVEVPAGHHDVAIRFGPTPVRLAATLISLAGLLALAGLAWRLPTPAFAIRQPVPGWREAWPVLAGIALLFALKVGYLNHGQSIFRRSAYDGQSVSGIAAPERVLFEDQMVYLGHDGVAESVAAGDSVQVTLYWATQGALETDYSTNLTLRDAAGEAIAQSDNQHPADWPTSRWLPGEYAADAHTLSIPPDTAPGNYSLQVSVYRVAVDGVTQPLVALDEMGNPATTTPPVMSIHVAAP